MPVFPPYTRVSIFSQKSERSEPPPKISLIGHWVRVAVTEPFSSNQSLRDFKIHVWKWTWTMHISLNAVLDEKLITLTVEVASSSPSSQNHHRDHLPHSPPDHFASQSSEMNTCICQMSFRIPRCLFLSLPPFLAAPRLNKDQPQSMRRTFVSAGPTRSRPHAHARQPAAPLTYSLPTTTLSQTKSPCLLIQISFHM